MFRFFKKKKKETLIFKTSGRKVAIHDGRRIYHPEMITIGDNVIIGQHALIEGMGGVTIGNNVILGPAVTIWSANHNYEDPNLLPYD